MSMEIRSSHHHEEATGNLMRPGSEYPPGMQRGGAPATATHRRQFQPIPAPFMSFRPPTSSTPMTMPHHHQGQLRFHGHHGGSRPFHQPPPGANPGAADGVASTTHQRFTAMSAASRSAVGVYAPSRRIWNPKSTLMTMFYNGAVNVFDVPVDKAQEIMVLASRASVSTPPRPTEIQKPDFHVPGNTRFAVPDPRKTFATHVSTISSRIPAVPQAPMLSKSTPPGYQNYAPDPTTSSGVPSSVVPPVCRASSAQPMQQASSVAVAAAVRPIAVRQSRKASLARFLEKRKDRVSSVTPYQVSKSPLESSRSLGSASTPSRLSSADNAPPSNNCQESMSYVSNDAMSAIPHRVVIELE
ncbi:protein TIFY 6a-like [Triticum dicoccoides]|uniref:protein TIFY 6a-like n=1 Tax=Triticum dicoccoides TaxID=85692 RepID=UPI00188E9D20|nr:protein TIFY 6a-like [Triticum dicoccoides]